MSVMGELIGAFSHACDIHNASCEHPANGIGLAHMRVERLGFDEGEEILPGVKIVSDGGPADSFRVLCDGQHGGNEAEQETQAPVKAVSDPNPSRMDPVYV